MKPTWVFPRVVVFFPRNCANGETSRHQQHQSGSWQNNARHSPWLFSVFYGRIPGRSLDKAARYVSIQPRLKIWVFSAPLCCLRDWPSVMPFVLIPGPTQPIPRFIPPHITFIWWKYRLGFYHVFGPVAIPCKWGLRPTNLPVLSCHCGWCGFLSVEAVEDLPVAGYSF